MPPPPVPPPLPATATATATAAAGVGATATATVGATATATVGATATATATATAGATASADDTAAPRFWETRNGRRLVRASHNHASVFLFPLLESVPRKIRILGGFKAEKWDFGSILGRFGWAWRCFFCVLSF
jgi:hypothetical protein